MCKKLDPAHTDDTEFNPRTECCSFNPKLPNFLVGGILQNEDPNFEGDRLLIEMRAASQAINPYAMKAPWLYWVHYHDHPFGQSEKLLCPYYIDRDGGLCGIYQYRNGRCSTWFCKYEHRRFGYEFWQAVDHLLTAMEDELAKWCVQEIDLKRSLDPTDFPAFEWGVWVGRERDFFRKCWELVHQLTVDEAIEHAGEAIRPLAVAVVKAFAALEPGPIPEILRPAKFDAVVIGENRVRVRAYARLDPIDLDADLVSAISAFDGRRTAEVLETLALQGIHIDSELLRTLYNYKILVSG